MSIYPIFPGGKRKVFTLSFDDAWRQDRPLIKLMNKYGIKYARTVTCTERFSMLSDWLLLNSTNTTFIFLMLAVSQAPYSLPTRCQRYVCYICYLLFNHISTSNKKTHPEGCAEKVFPSVSLPHYTDFYLKRDTYEQSRCVLFRQSESRQNCRLF